MSLNPAQQKVVDAPNGATLVLAGAGTGKTHTLTERVVRLIEDGMAPHKILLLTFTRKASREMLERVAIKLKEKNSPYAGSVRAPVSGGTFHSTALKILKHYRTGTGSFQILDDSDYRSLIKNALTQVDLIKELNEELTLKQLIKIFSLKKNTLKTIKDSIQDFQSALMPYCDLVEDCFKASEAYRLKLELMTYDDILVHFLELLQSENGDAIRRRFDTVLVDEYQDTTKLQVEILHALSRQHQSIMAVGDDCQSIYSFRGALCTQMQDFIKTFPDTVKITLEGNYRSTKEILDFCNSLIKDSTAVFPKELKSALDLEGSGPEIVSSNTSFENSFKLIDTIQNQVLQGHKLSEQAVLYRSSRQTRFLEMELDKLAIPYIKNGGLKFNESAHMKDYFSLLNFFLNPSNEPASLRVLQMLNGIGPKSALRLSKELREKKKLTPPKAAVEDLSSLKETLKEAVLAEDAQEQAYKLLLWYKNYGEIKYDNFNERLADLDFLIERLEAYTSIEEMIEDLHLNSDEDELDDEEKLTLSTVHSSKGKEWNCVYILDAGDKSFPLRETSYDIIEEERRLLYVAATRAKKTLRIFYPLSVEQGDKTYQSQKPSRFIPSLQKTPAKVKRYTEPAKTLETSSFDFFEEPEGDLAQKNDSDDGFEELVYNYDETW